MTLGSNSVSLACPPTLRSRAAWACVAALLVSLPAQSQQGLLTLETLYSADSDVRVEYTKTLPAVRWLDDESYLETQGTGDDRVVLKVDAASGESSPFYDAAAMTRGLAELPGMSESQARSLATRSLRLDPASRSRARFFMPSSRF